MDDLLAFVGKNVAIDASDCALCITCCVQNPSPTNQLVCNKCFEGIQNQDHAAWRFVERPQGRSLKYK